VGQAAVPALPWSMRMPLPLQGPARVALAGRAHLSLSLRHPRPPLQALHAAGALMEGLRRSMISPTAAPQLEVAQCLAKGKMDEEGGWPGA
jgi:hypothetical protein